MRKGILLLLCTGLTVGTASWASPAKPQTIQYEIKLKSEAFGDMGTRKMWIKGGKMRWEYMGAGLPLKLVKNEQGVFLIHPWRKYAGKYPRGTNRENPIALFPGPTAPVDQFLKTVKATKRGSEKVGGELCSIYDYKEPAGDKLCRIWVDGRSGKPVKLTTRSTRGKSDLVTATYTKFAVGGTVSDSLFQLPKGYSIKPIPASSITSGVTKGKERKDPV